MQHTPLGNLQQHQTPSGSPLPPETKAAESATTPPLFYTQEDDDLELHLPTNDPLNTQEAPFVLPFQSSTPIPMQVSATHRAMEGPSSSGTIQRQTTPAANLPTPDTVPSAQRLSDLGWTQAGLSASDAIEALRTATTFTDRKMSYDYRAIGTPAHHSGTFTSASFLLTPGGQTRFAQNDVRVINNVLYEKIAQGKIIRQVVNAQATLVQLQGITVQGQVHLCAWINVSFSLFQSKLDPASGKRIDGLLANATTGQPNRYQMAVVLVWVAPPDAPMGGTGWLVNTYALDATSPPILEISPSI